MAEVPEVEILAQGLREAVIGRNINCAAVLRPEAVRFPLVEEFIALMSNRTVLTAQRKAKYILMTFSGDVVLATHMMLWGTLALVPTEQTVSPTTMLIWHLDQRQDLRLIDPLGYARAAAGPPDLVGKGLDLDSLGPDALEPTFTDDVLAARLAKRRGILRTVLINQRVLAGLGVRDADESLWLAQINPYRVPSSLNSQEITRLRESIVQILTEGLALRGTQRDLFGQKGQASHGRYVFEKAGRPCPRCGTIVMRERIANRNVYYCPQCQQ